MRDFMLASRVRLLPGALLLVVSTALVPAYAQTGPSDRSGAPGPAPAQNAPAVVGTIGGAPFPSMAAGAARSAPQGQGRPQLPLVGQTMEIDDKDLSERLDRMGEQVDERMRNLRVGSGQLPAPDLSPRRGELEGRAAAERRIRELELRRREAEAAIQLWSTIYDPRREEEAARQARAPAPEPVAAPAPPPPPQPIAPVEAASSAQNNAVPGLDAVMPMPKIVTVRGGAATGLSAQLLVPYVGEVAASVGTRLPGGRQVVRINSDGVMVSDPHLGVVSLGFGDSVPLAPPAPAATRSAPRNPASELPTPTFTMPTPPAMPPIIVPARPVSAPVAPVVGTPPPRGGAPALPPEAQAPMLIQ